MPTDRLRRLVLVLPLVIFSLLQPVNPGGAHGTPVGAAESDLIGSMLAEVDPNRLRSLVGGLSGAWPVVIEGQPFSISTRHALSGLPVGKAAQYLYQFYDDLGLEVQYHPFSYRGYSLSNVVAQKEGSVNPEKILLITSHYDDVPVSGPAPGADDNASGTAAVMMAAEILSQYDFGCTLRFANFSAEEYGLIGSMDYAHQAYCSAEDIQGVINLDMLAWNTAQSPPDMDLHVLPSIPGSNELATTFMAVVAEYNLDLIPELANPITTRSDHASFWKYDYPAILVIEDWQDFNPNYHSVDDDLENLQDLSYYTSMVKASLGTLAKSGCLVEEGWGTLSGQVLDADTKLPVQGAAVRLYNPNWDNTWFTTSDENGFYQFSVLSGWHKLSADSLGYAGQETDVLIVRDQITEMDFEIEARQETAVFLPLSANSHSPLLDCP